MHETGGVLRAAVAAYLTGGPMTGAQIAYMRAYLRQWIAAPGWQGPDIDALRMAIDRLATRVEIAAWLERAMDAGIDPL
jgi:hypothetical protein